MVSELDVMLPRTSTNETLKFCRPEFCGNVPFSRLFFTCRYVFRLPSASFAYVASNFAFAWSRYTFRY